MNEDPRAKEDGICRITRIGATGIEWICVAPVHDVAYVRKTGDRNHRKGEVIFSNNPKTEQHFMVRRWLNRSGVSTEVDTEADSRAAR